MPIRKPFDTHIHLQHLQQSIESCLAISDCLVPAVTVEDWEQIIGLAQNHSAVIGAIGIHPWHAHQYDPVSLEREVNRAANLLSRYSDVCIGEVGLDFDPRTPASHEWQKTVLNAFLRLAQNFRRPVSVHLRKAHADFDRMLADHGEVSAFLHGFSGGINWARHFIKTGRVMIGVNGVVCRGNARRYHQLARELPLEHIVLETDAPYVRLPGHDNFRCDDIMAVANRLASLRDCSADEIIMTTRNNARSLLNATLGHPPV